MCKRAVRGSTLIELLLSLTLSLLLLSLLLAIYEVTRRQDETQTALMAVHANSRLVLQSLSAELKTAGFIGCPSLMVGFPLGNSTGYLLNSRNSIELQQEEAGSTRIIIRHRGAHINFLRAPLTQASILEVSADYKIKVGRILLLSDCRHADLFQVAQVADFDGGQRLRTSAPLRYRYSEKAEVGEWEVNTYFVEKTGRSDELGRPVYALYRSDLAGNKTEWVDGVESLKAEEILPAGPRARRGISIAVKVRSKALSKTEYAFVALPKSEADKLPA